MTDDLRGELISYLADARAMELQALELLKQCIDRAGDEDIAAIYRTHRLQTEEHVHDVTERLRAHTEDGNTEVSGASTPDIELVATSVPASPTKLARTAYAFENLEIAAYHLLSGLARRVGDRETVALAERILEQEEATAELLASRFDRMLELSFG